MLVDILNRMNNKKTTTITKPVNYDRELFVNIRNTTQPIDGLPKVCTDGVCSTAWKPAKPVMKA